MRQPFLLVPLLLFLGCSRDLADETVSVYFTDGVPAIHMGVVQTSAIPIPVRLGYYYWTEYSDLNYLSIIGFHKTDVGKNAVLTKILVPSDIESLNLALEYSKTSANQEKYEAWKNEKVKEEDNE